MKENTQIFLKNFRLSENVNSLTMTHFPSNKGFSNYFVEKIFLFQILNVKRVHTLEGL